MGPGDWHNTKGKRKCEKFSYFFRGGNRQRGGVVGVIGDMFQRSGVLRSALTPVTLAHTIRNTAAAHDVQVKEGTFDRRAFITGLT